MKNIMTTKDIKDSIDEMMDSKLWNYIIIISAIITIGVAARNIYLYSKRIEEISIDT